MYVCMYVCIDGWMYGCMDILWMYGCMSVLCTYLVCIMYVSIFIKLHITAQSGPVIGTSHSMPLALILSSQGGINDTCYENL